MSAPRPVSAAVLTALVCAGSLAAQELPTYYPDLTITGFASIPWGTRLDVVIQNRGEPSQVSDDWQGLQVLVYQDELLGEDAIVSLMVHPEKGLIKGAYGIVYGMGSDCLAVFRRLREAIAERYASIKVDENRFNNSSLDFCGGVTIGKAGWSAMWQDPVDSRVRVGMILAPESRHIAIHYEGPGFEEWREGKEKAEVRKKF